MRRALLVALSFGAIVCAGCGSGSSPHVPNGEHVDGQELVSFAANSTYIDVKSGGSCDIDAQGVTNDGGLRKGTPVTLKDAAGRLLATDHLRGGKVDPSRSYCGFSFDFKTVNTSSSKFLVQVGDFAPIVYTHQELVDAHYEMDVYNSAGA